MYHVHTLSFIPTVRLSNIIDLIDKFVSTKREIYEERMNQSGRNI